MCAHKYQQAVIDEYARTNRNIFVSATAGAGKTTLLVELSKRTPPTRDSIFLAFNKSIAQELANRLPPTRKAQTLHSCALSALRRAYRLDIDITDSKYFYMALDGLKWPEKQPVKQRMSICSKVARLYDLMRVNNLYGGDKEVFALGLRYGEEVSDEVVDRAIKLHAIATQAADRFFYTNEGGKLKMDFTDMLTYAIRYVPDRDFKKYSVVMTDEIQDLNPLQYELIKKLKSPGGRLIGVGDQRQSIYSFQGSNLDTLNAIKDAPNTVSLPLSMTYRCAKAIVNEALTVFPNGIEAAPFAVEGEVDRLILHHMIFHYSAPPARFTASIKARLALSTAMCIRKSLAARQESRGLMSSFTAWPMARELRPCVWRYTGRTGGQVAAGHDFFQHVPSALLPGLVRSGLGGPLRIIEAKGGGRGHVPQQGYKSRVRQICLHILPPFL